MYRSPDSFDILHPVRPSNDPSTDTVRLPIAATHYLDKLGLSSAQRNWVESQVVRGLQAQVGQRNEISPAWFALMQTAIGALAEDSDELNARLATASPAARAQNHPARWFKKQQFPALLRSSMASKRFVRKIREYIREDCIPIRTPRTTSCAKNTGRQRVIHVGAQQISGYSKRWSSSYPYSSAQQTRKAYAIIHISVGFKRSACLSQEYFNLAKPATVWRFA
ncbi:hypothetical protein H7F10_06850 [Acidithiobacillus sp. HP-6]|uniref:hypothetical protein n=1 Tax=unclassified Acidithiobacillus TaxID=2614800 RepID=UPI00187A1318|nr:MULTISPECIES: hypothetical protein [unclassified Acidithiobacillus]MBE7562672.1 hypothetical protein [Acidithiobacillus sp. HP-6]MBE7570532.1 hypothetical protein [Acidithiobacillus sp. HP-2]